MREALSRLAAAREMDGRVVVDLPIMYPSGAMVVVQVERNGDKVLVSDMGCGLVEAEQRKGLGSELDQNLLDKIENPINFKPLTKDLAHGYEAEIMVSVCKAIILCLSG